MVIMFIPSPYDTLPRNHGGGFDIRGMGSSKVGIHPEKLGKWSWNDGNIIYTHFMSLAPIVGESQLLMIMNSSDLSEFKNQLVPLWELISSKQ